MATALTVKQLYPRETAVDTSTAWTSIAGLVSGGAYIDCSGPITTVVPGSAAGDAMLEIRVTNTTGSQKTVTIKAPTGANAYTASAIADKVLTLAATSGEQTIFINSVNYKDRFTGYITLAFQSGMTGAIAVFGIPQ